MFLARHPFLAPLIYLLPGMLYLKYTVDQFFGAQGANITTTQWLILSLYFICGLVALLHGYFSYQDPLQKARVRILTLGTLSGVLPFLIFKIGLEEFSAEAQWTQLGVVPLVAIPISFGYCIARYRVMQIEFLLRRSLLYSLTTGAIILAYLALVLGLGGIVLQWTGPTNQFISFGATLAIAGLLWPVRSRVQRTIDRRFFRARESFTAVLEEFSREIPQLLKTEELLQRVGNRLCDLLSLPTLGIYIGAHPGNRQAWRLAGQITRQSNREPKSTSASFVSVVELPGEISLPVTSKIMERRNEPFWIEAPPVSRISSRDAITREQAELAARFAEQEALFNIGVVLIVPLATQGRLVGLFALPAKPDGEPYELHEIQVLTIVAGQVALQVENARLYEEEVAKQKLEEEMAMARTIQSRLLPSTIPSLPGVDLGAVNISSRQVSGDYFDMILKEDGCLGIVIADVSGKGMPASLLASNLQAALRAQCDTGASPGVILERVNRQLHASTDPHHFATLFFAVFDPAKKLLRYSSGGHNAPVLLRCNGQIELLDKGGLPLGAFEFGTYDEGEITLEPGDLLFLYTDGVTETQDTTLEDEFGEDRLNRLLLANQGLSVDELIHQVNNELRTFSGREDADDDITLVALKVLNQQEEVRA
jgi:sigma-B regulation protein RsbU (phosphoserine phosphatase)